MTCPLSRFLLLSLLPVALAAQNRIGTGAAHELYQQNCASCHGANLEGGLGASLMSNSNYKQVGQEISFLEYVKKGNLSMGMPPFEQALTDSEIRSLEIYIDEVRQERGPNRANAIQLNDDGSYVVGTERFRLSVFTKDVVAPWSMAFMPNTDLLVTEKGGSLVRISKKGLKVVIDGLPDVWVHGQGGLLEVALHPNYAENGWVYLSFSASSGEVDGKAVGMTKVVRGRIRENVLVDQEVLFEAPIQFQRSSGVHFGSRFVFKDGYLYFGIGDRGSMEMAQDLSKPNGKIHRIHDDGRIPEDNPFVDVAGAYPSIWTYGNRNPQGLDLDPVTGELWESEHGPRGGDEINLIVKGTNYGWPEISYGMNYNGKPITSKTAEAGMAQPKHYWTPSIAVCGIDFYEGTLFPSWKGNLFAGGLASQELHRLVIDNGKVVKDEIILKDLGRIRDVASGPNGGLFILFNGPDQIVRLEPAK